MEQKQIKPLIAGNWKMNGVSQTAQELAQGLAAHYANHENPNFDLLICPPFTLLSTVVDIVKESGVAVGGQDCHVSVNGAHTGDISAEMLADIGCDYVILGHSERRQDHFETSELVADKAAAAHAAGLKTIICVGETEAEREAGKAIDVVHEQLTDSLPSSLSAENTVIAYEPVWAIGTGKSATPDDILEIHQAIRKKLAQFASDSTEIRILYGGSVKPENADEILKIQDVNGALVGGASLSVADFWAIAESCD